MTTILRTIAALREWRAAGGSVALVPTMGALHAGHASLIERARSENDRVVVSIFVNPTQFGPGEDFQAYPRDEATDLALLEGLEADAAFCPAVEEVYPPGDATRVVPGEIAERLEGAHRPGHFTGVATVVTKLFALVQPRRAYFGQKDFQQLRVLQTVTRDLRLPVAIIPCPTVREPDGLALSSRNRYLTAAERGRASALWRGLAAAGDAHRAGERDPERLGARTRAVAAAAGELEYVSVADPFTLVELRSPGDRADQAVISLACRVGKARLIDNALVGLPLEELH